MSLFLLFTVIFSTIFNLSHKFSIFHSFIDDLVEAEERAFLRRIILFHINTPIINIYPNYLDFKFSCDNEISFLFPLAFFITGLCFQSHFKNSNIADFLTKDQLSPYFNYIFKFGSSDFNFDSLYKYKKEEFFYNIPILFKNLSFLIVNRLELPSYEAEIESVFTTYIDPKFLNIKKSDLLLYLKNKHPIDFLNPSLLPTDFLKSLEDNNKKQLK